MVKNEQAIRAFREILTHIETATARADAIFELMLERGQINKQELEQAMDAARARQEAKWAQVRAKVDSLLKEEADKATARVA
jgi:membrane peptidoglycan carboxypeptidase